MPTKTAESVAISEARPLKETVADVTNHRMRIRIIEGNRWGSSGYYGADMLKRDIAKAFPAGTQMYIDHPSESEEFDRPERTIKDLAAVFLDDPVYENDGAYVNVRVYEHWAHVISEMAEDIGVSIRAVAEMEPGEINGQKGPIITSLLEGISVDFVTKAGAGGAIVKVLESARKASLEAKKMGKENKNEAEEATSNNRRAQLTVALKNHWDGFECDLWVKDLDEEKRLVYYHIYTYDSHRLYAHEFQPATDDKSVTLVGDPYEVMTQVEYVQLPSLPQPTSAQESNNKTDPPDKSQAAGKGTGEVEEQSGQPTREDPMGQTTIDETELAKLRESSNAADSLREELKEARDNERKARVAEAKATARANREHARRIVADQLHEAGVKAPSLAQAFSVDPPLLSEGDNAGQVDEEKLKESVKEAVGEIQVELDESSGGVRGFGSSAAGEEETITEADLDKLSAGIFGREVKS